MPTVTKEILSQAVAAIGAMSLHQREQLLDEVRARQSNLLYSVLATRRFEVTYEQLEVVLNILLVCFQSMKLTGRQFKVIDELMQERCLGRITGRMRFLEGLSLEQKSVAANTAITEHPEIWLFAFAFNHLSTHGLMGIRTDAEKYLVLAALNVVECIAEAVQPAAKVKK